MNEQESKKVKDIREAYSPKTAKQTKLEELVELDGKARRPAEIFSYTFGVISALMLGMGMCLSMKVIGSSLSFGMPLGIVLGVVGIGLCAVNYFIYRAMLKAGKRKYEGQILALSDELLNK